MNFHSFIFGLPTILCTVLTELETGEKKILKDYTDLQDEWLQMTDQFALS